MRCAARCTRSYRKEEDVVPSYTDPVIVCSGLHPNLAIGKGSWQDATARMCFGGDESGPDIWLTVENGKYVPAPPMVYVPGLRQIQRRLRPKADHIWVPPPIGGNIVWSPMSSEIYTSFPRPSVRGPVSSGTSDPVTDLSRAPQEYSHQKPSLSTSAGHKATLTKTTSANKPAQASTTPEATQRKSTEQPAGAPPEAQPEQQQENVAATNEGADYPGDCDVSSLSSDTPLRPSISTTSLRSILKKPPPSTSVDRALEKGARAAGKEGQEDEAGAKRVRGPKVTKSVSFVEGVAFPASARDRKTATHTTAAEEGAAIAKTFVQKGLPLHSQEKNSHGFGGGRDLRSRIWQSKPGKAATDPGRGRREYWKHRESAGSSTGAPCTEFVGRSGAGYEQARRTSLAHYLHPNERDGSNIDDEIPRNWP